jgi:hypothetical protein
MQGRSWPATEQHLYRGDKNTVVTKSLFLRGQPNMSMLDRQLGPFMIEENNIGQHSYILKLSPTLRSYHVFHINKLQPGYIVSLRHVALVTTLEDDNEDFDVSNIFAVCVKPLDSRRGKYMLL